MLDLVYGLLEEAESQAVRAHVDACPSCREALTIAQVQQRRIARAAQPILDVPAFEPPTQDDRRAATEDAPAAEPAVPAQPPSPSPRGRRRAWPVAVLLALSLLLAVGFGISYRRGYRDLDNQIAQAQAEVRKLDRQVSAARAAFSADVAKASAELKQKFPIIEASGDAHYVPGRANTFDVRVRDLDGLPVATPLLVQVVDKASGAEIYRAQHEAANNNVIELPRDLPPFGKEAFLVVNAGNTLVQEKLDYRPPSHMLHLLCNKAVYQPGELLFFRALALERFHLKPPARPLALKATLADVHGNPVLERTMTTTASGIAADSFALPPELGEGLYSVVVVGQGETVAQPTTRIVEVVRETKPFVVRLDRNRVGAGEQVTGVINLQDNGKPLANQNVDVTATLEGNVDRGTYANNSAPPQGAATQRVQNTLKVQTDAKGEARLNIPVPPTWTNRVNSLRFDLNVGKQRQEAVESIEVTPREWTVDFFPEGGDLVVGAPQRVYFRVHTLSGEPLEPEGTIALFDDHGKLFESDQGIGVFTLKADADANYQVEISPKKGMKRKMPAFANLPIQREGLILHVPSVVQAEGKAVDVVLHNMHAPRPLLVTATCRGQMVGYQRIDAARGENKLSVPAEGVGILRLTVHDLSRRKAPLAERLVFRLPSRPLELTVNFNREGFAPRDTAKLEIESSVASCWSSVAVVDRRFCSDQREPSLTEHFLVLGELAGGDDLDQANLMIADNDEAKAALELFLSTIGWRRFVPEQQSARSGTTTGATPAGTSRGRAVSAPVYFQRQNDPAELRKSYEEALEQKVAGLRTDLGASVGSWLEERSSATAHLDQLRARFHAYQELPRQALVLIVFGLFGILVALGCYHYARALYTWVGRRASATLHFGKGFAYLTAALVLFLVRGQFGILLEPVKVTPGQALPLAELPSTRDVVANLVSPPRAAAPTAGRVPIQPAEDVVSIWMQSGPSKLAPLAKKESRQDEAQELARHIEALALGQNLRSSQRGSYLGNDEMQKALALQNAGNPQYANQYHAALRDQQMFRNPAGGYGYEPKQQSFNNPTLIAPARPRDNEAKLVREYIHQPVPGMDMQDTLVWKPLLKIDKGRAELEFHISSAMTNYRVLVFGHTADGQLGYYTGTLEVKKPAK
jgi:hypothetical protein